MTLNVKWSNNWSYSRYKDALDLMLNKVLIDAIVVSGKYDPFNP